MSYLNGFYTQEDIDRGRHLAERGVTDPAGMLDQIALLAWKNHCRQLTENQQQENDQHSTINKEIENG